MFLKWRLRQLTSSNPFTRAKAASKIGEMRDIRGVEPLLSILKTDPEFFVRSNAVVALGEIGDSRVVDDLIDEILLTDRTASGRSESAFISSIIYSLNRLRGGARAVSAIRPYLQHTSRRVQLAATHALNDMEWQPESIADAALFAVQRVRHLHLSQHKWEDIPRFGEAAIPPLVDALIEDGKELARYKDTRYAPASEVDQIVSTLRLLGGEAVHSIISLLSHTELDVRLVALEALERLHDLRAVEAILRAASNDEDYSIRSRAEKALTAMGAEDAVRRLKQSTEEKADKEKHGRIKRIVILMNKRPLHDEAAFVQQILSTLTVYGEKYTALLSEQTSIRTFEVGNLDYYDETAVLTSYCFSACVRLFGSPPPKEDIEKLTLAPFESSYGIRGNVVAQFYEKP